MEPLMEQPESDAGSTVADKRALETPAATEPLIGQRVIPTVMEEEMPPQLAHGDEELDTVSKVGGSSSAYM
jgi:hypothetical protein